ncbi:hypothetical protein C7H19_09520 [Aphanothece hegewaldii CCALA 016]|uniref:XRE family transcriptional regulator n=1 Tax=Aphanothece hegewaldii CCALA 016 TaxID=2107694 RepID=A0A2T1LZI5_9CHRO|nr:hypothetical protein C7H19_09520 [Aphanothece hegewaldii CCALA 016]
MLSCLLKEWELNYKEFADLLGISYGTLWGYRKGTIEFKLNWEQCQKLEKLLKQVGLSFSDLEPDWIRDNIERESNDTHSVSNISVNIK